MYHRKMRQIRQNDRNFCRNCASPVCGRGPAYLGHLGVPDGDELLGDDRQHLDVNAVELIKAAPGP